jgi:hypothetical protein
MESKKLKKWEKQIHKLEWVNRTRYQTRRFQRYKQGALVYSSTVSWSASSQAVWVVATGGPGAHLVCLFNMSWRFSSLAGGVEESKLCLFSVIMPAKCVSSGSPRFHYRRLPFCFLPLAPILEWLEVLLYQPWSLESQAEEAQPRRRTATDRRVAADHSGAFRLPGRPSLVPRSVLVIFHIKFCAFAWGQAQTVIRLLLSLLYLGLCAYATMPSLFFEMASC